jgi:hypothetical protein
MSLDWNTLMPWVLGGLGGVAPDVLRILNIVKSGQSLSGVFNWRLWVSLIILVPVGAFTAWLLQATTPIQALTCGFSAPEILSRLLSSRSNLPPGGQGGSTGPVDRVEEGHPTPPTVTASKPGLLSWWAD